MDVFHRGFSGQTPQPEPAGTAEPCLQPTLDGKLVQGPDFSRTDAGGPISIPEPRRLGPLFAIAIGVLLALFVAKIGSAHAAWSNFSNHFANLFSAPAPSQASAKNTLQLDRMKPQKQAETLLEQAVGRSDGAVEQISSRVDHWQGNVKWNPQIAKLTTAALNSSDLRVRESGIEVELAAYGLAKNSASLDYLLNTAESPDHAQKIWALWALGLMANRGVETDRVVQVLTAHLKDADADSRRWAVEGLALAGSAQTIDPLLKTMHDDPSPSVRERAACGLAESGTFTPEQRLTAVPQLLDYTDDPALDAQTHAWAFQALSDITRHHLPNDSAAWRSWYENTVASGQ
ncbi:MAG TPA: HEAT repeat domain-containing protein [Candidatus Sulfotelmatobacter sp.]|nr:HEAT repeat domain-containing protein [Candidatus Sulfotelmatobacter sp.]